MSDNATNTIINRALWEKLCAHNTDIHAAIINGFFDNTASLAYYVKSALFGLAIGDSLGVPVEYIPREKLHLTPITDMKGHGTWNQPPGTWSDDTALSLCLAEALTVDFSLERIAHNFVKWLNDGYWSALGEVFDVGNTTRGAINRLMQGINPKMAGDTGIRSNGNGGLMRILPLLFEIWYRDLPERFEHTKNVCSITHGHIRSILSCHYYLEFNRLLLLRNSKSDAYRVLQTVLPDFWYSLSIPAEEIHKFDKVLQGNIWDIPETSIISDGYTVHSLEASIYCLMTTSNYREAVLKAVNLGGDSDTTACITGGLAGICFGFDDIPQKWVNGIARSHEITDLAERLAASSLLRAKSRLQSM